MDIQEYDVVVLTHDIPEFGLRTGDHGTAVLVYTSADFEVEFIGDDGRTIALLTLTDRDVRRAPQ